MELWCQEITSGRDRNLLKIIRQNFEKVKRESTNVKFGLPKRSILGENFLYRSLTFINNREVIEGVRQAEKLGFDGAIIDCFYDPCLREAKEIAGIPVVGPAEASMILSSMMCSRFAVITFHPKAIHLIEENIKLCGMESKVIGNKPVRSLTLSLKMQYEGILRPKKLIEDFVQVAQGCLKEGAEAIIVGCTLISPVLLKEGLKEIDGAVVIDPLIAALKMAEILVDLRNANLPWISRKGLYRTPNESMIKAAIELVPYDGPGSVIINE